MTASFQEIINSRLFKFIVGEDVDNGPTEFFVHQEAIARLSRPLNRLTKGEMAEAKTGNTIWKDVKKDTFERLVQFAYTGDYSIPKTGRLERAVSTKDEGKGKKKETNGSATGNLPSPIIDEVIEVKEYPVLQEVDEVQVFEPPNDWVLGWGATSSKKDVKGKKKSPKKRSASSFGTWEPEAPCVTEDEPTQVSDPFSFRPDYPPQPAPLLAANFHTLSYPLLTPRDNYHESCEPQQVFDATQSYASVFLAHAELFILGDYWLIDSLKALSLFKLHKTLCIFKLDSDHMPDIVNLARYVYSEDGKGIDEENGGVRGLVCQYLAHNSSVLALDDQFMDLLGEGGQFVKDFFKFEVQTRH